MNKLLKNKGFTLPEVLVASAILGAIVLVVVQSAKMQMANNAASSADNDIASASQQILNTINSPSGCNANFRNSSGVSLSASGAFSMDNIYKCGTTTVFGPCTGATSSANTTVIYQKVAATTSTDASWTLANTGFLSGKVRITQIDGVLSQGAAGYNNLVPVTLTVTFQKRLGEGKDPVTAPQNFRTLQRTFATSVVVVGSSFQGCPKAVNSTTVY